VKRAFLPALALLALLPASPARANFSGIWEGNGSWNGPQGQLPCPSMSLTVIHTRTTFTIHGGQFECAGLSRHWARYDLEIEGGTLFHRGQAVGKAVGNKIYFTQTHPEGTTTVEAQTRPGFILYKETKRSPSGETLHSLEGTLKDTWAE
jgi:hypothetical protein